MSGPPPSPGLKVQLTGPLKVPVKRTPEGSPPVPFAEMMKEPPPARMPPVDNDPDIRFPVVKKTPPRLLPVTVPKPSKPLIEVRVDPLGPVVSEPVGVVVIRPPEYAKSTLLSANAASGRKSSSPASAVVLINDISYLPK